VKSILIVLVTSNRGLCGSFNAQIYRKLRSELASPEKMRINRVGEEKIAPKISGEKLNIEFITIGKKGENFVRKLGYNIIATFPNLTYFSPSEETRPAARIIMDSYLEKKYDKIAIIYTDYISAVNQKTRIRQILPISEIDLEKQIVEMDIMAKEYGVKIPDLEYKVEPSPREVLSYIFPRLIEMQIYHAILESVASKESARMVAMKNATEAGNDMADMLTLAFNQIRQAKITQEISEISAGRVALEE
jgi:F-type H+-transporting ATPase subunit gamma